MVLQRRTSLRHLTLPSAVKAQRGRPMMVKRNGFKKKKSVAKKGMKLFKKGYKAGKKIYAAGKKAYAIGNKLAPYASMAAKAL